MTGDYCDSTQSCCGGSPDALHPTNDPYGVFCDTAGKRDYPPYNDSSSQDDFRCTNGTSCNPPGNICGGSGATNASQNCCDGKKAVCKPDSNGIYRCFGGCPHDDCSQCPTGYDANNPACCIATADPDHVTTANVCQFRDQCCGGAPCVPDATGVLHCTTPGSCAPAGTSCTGPDDASCCAPNSCQLVGTGIYQCKLDTQCAAVGGTCAGDADCCSHSCDLETATCLNACVAAGGSCTVSADCCAGIVCDIPPGATSGTCGSVSTCAADSQSCNAATPCCTGVCYNGVDTYGCDLPGDTGCWCQSGL